MTPLTSNCKFLWNKAAVAAGTSDQDGAVVDMADFDTVLAVVQLGTVVDGSVLELQWQGSAAANGSSPTTEATTGAVTAATSSNKLLVLEVQRSAYRYGFPRLKRGTQNATVMGFLVIQGRPRTGPVTKDASALLQALASIG
jgi:hypothetical protein